MGLKTDDEVIPPKNTQKMPPLGATHFTSEDRHREQA